MAETATERTVPTSAATTLLPVLSCDDCGACCFTQCSPPFVFGPGFDSPLSGAVALDYQEGMAKREADGWPDDVPCFWLDLVSMRCRHYEHRPLVCREFDVGSEGCLAWRDEFNVDVELYG